MASKKRIMRRFRIDEISGVDRPAQKGARAVIMKRDSAESAEELVKRGAAALTTAVDDHTHLISLEDWEGFQVSSGTTSHHSESAKPNTYGHSHPWIMEEDGSIKIGEVEGHTHEVDAMSKAELAKRFAGISLDGGRYPIRNATDLSNVIGVFTKAEDKPTLARHVAKRAEALNLTAQLPSSGELADLLKTTTHRPSTDGGHPTGGIDMPGEAELQKKLDDANARITKTAAMIAGLLALSAAGAEYVKALPEAEREGFLEKSAEDQQKLIDADLAKRQDRDPVVFTASDGTEYRKSDDERLVKMAKDRDADRAALQKAERAREDSEFTKRAETEMANLTGETTMKVAVIRAIEKGEAITDEAVRKAALEMLKGANEAVRLGKSFGRQDPSLQQDFDPIGKADAEAQLDKMAEEYAEKNSISKAVAYAKVLDTDKGRALYNKSLGSAGMATH